MDFRINSFEECRTTFWPPRSSHSSKYYWCWLNCLVFVVFFLFSSSSVDVSMVARNGMAHERELMNLALAWNVITFMKLMSFSSQQHDEKNTLQRVAGVKSAWQVYNCVNCYRNTKIYKLIQWNWWIVMCEDDAVVATNSTNYFETPRIIVNLEVFGGFLAEKVEPMWLKKSFEMKNMIFFFFDFIARFSTFPCERIFSPISTLHSH